MSEVGPGPSSFKAWVSAISVIGIPGAIAVFLVYMGATEIPKLTQAVETTQDEVRANTKVLYEHTVQTERLIRLVQRVCSNTAKDDAMRQRCFDE